MIFHNIKYAVHAVTIMLALKLDAPVVAARVAAKASLYYLVEQKYLNPANWDLTESGTFFVTSGSVQNLVPMAGSEPSFLWVAVQQIQLSLQSKLSWQKFLL